MTTAATAHPVFQQALDNIQRTARLDPAFWPALRNGRGLRLDDLLGMRLAFEEGADDALFDHRLFDRLFVVHHVLARAYARYWHASVPDHAERLAMCELFLLHELLHVGQSAHSDVYYVHGHSTLDLFAGIDYDADAQALRMAFDLSWRGGGAPERKALWVRLLEAQFRGGMVFGHLENAPPAAAAATLAGARLRRQSVWGLQFARARAFLPESDAWKHMLGERVEWQWLPVGSAGPGSDLCDVPQVGPQDLAVPLLANFTVGGRMFKHTWLHARETEALAALLFQGELSRWNDAYRRLFTDEPFLTGRDAQDPGHSLPPAQAPAAVPSAGVTHHVTIDARNAQLTGSSLLNLGSITNAGQRRRT